MSTSRIAEKLLERPFLQRAMKEVVRQGVRVEFPAVVDSEECGWDIDIDWEHLLTCASILAQAEDSEKAQQTALRIADTCLKCDHTTDSSRRNAAAIIFHIMANKRALKLAQARGVVDQDFSDLLPLPLSVDYEQRELENCILDSSGQRFDVNKFQRDLWTKLGKNHWVSASAPTSAGKSFILRLWVRDFFRNKPNAQVVYLVPTRALIQEVQADFLRDMEEGQMPSVELEILPLQNNNEAQGGGRLYIFTQERLHILLARQGGLKFDLVVVDEAQKVGDGSRGVLLEQVITEITRRDDECRFLFASPFTENPEYLCKESPQSCGADYVKKNVVTVSQNLLYANPLKGKRERWELECSLGEETIKVGVFGLEDRATNEAKRFCFVAYALRSKTGGNVLYANGAAAAEKYAWMLAQCYGGEHRDAYIAANSRVAELVKLVKKTVHSDYRLAVCLEYGVAYHYGNMPLIIRAEIEALFRENIIQFLVCTGTLIEGVNLPCKMIFLRGPTKGNGKAMQDADFWNLAGRAGRWGTEFHGSIVCVDTRRAGVWKKIPNARRIPQRIVSTVESKLSEIDRFIDYCKYGRLEAKNEEVKEYDHAVTYMLSRMAVGGRLNEIPAMLGVQEVKIKELEAVLHQELEKTKIPHALIFKHVGILPRYLEELLAYFDKLSEDELKEHVPLLPEDDNAVERLGRIFTLINQHLRANWSRGMFPGKRLTALAILAVNWMRGKPLPVLIRRRWHINEAKAQKGERVKLLPAIIIEVMQDVEQYARFWIPKYLAAYLDILNLRANSLGVNVPINADDIELWLELGVSAKTHLSLMELGISRTAAIEIFNETMTDDKMSRNEVLKWLKELPDAIRHGLPLLINKEIDAALARYPNV